jgi:hypothetical protein
MYNLSRIQYDDNTGIFVHHTLLNICVCDGTMFAKAESGYNIRE